MARILGGAAVEAPARAAPRGAAQVAGPGRLRALTELLGGWPALGSLAASTVLGLAQPPALSGVFASLWGAA